MLHPVADCQPPVPLYDSSVSNQDSAEAAAGDWLAAFFANCFGTRIDRRDGGWITPTVGIDKGAKRLPTIRRDNGGLAYLLPLTVAAAQRAYRTGTVVGKRPSTYTDWVIVDVDADSRYHPETDPTTWASLYLYLTEDLGLSVAVVRSSASGGLHLIIPFGERRRSLTVARRLTALLAGAGFALGQGTLETFPNVPSGGNLEGRPLHHGVRLPCIEPASYLVDPFSLTPLGWRVALVEAMKAAIAVNEWRAILGTTPAPVKVSASSAQPGGPLPGGHGPQVAAVSVEGEGEREKTAPAGGFGQFVRRTKEKFFNLAGRFHWSETNRSNSVLGAHVAYVVEVEGVTDPAAIEARAWERAIAHGYHQNASRDEKRDHDHVRRWIKCRLNRAGVICNNAGRGDRRDNRSRSADSERRLRCALRGLRRQKFTTATALWTAVNSWLRSFGFAGLGKSTFWKMRLYWIAVVARGIASTTSTAPRPRWSPPLEQRNRQDDPAIPGKTAVLAPPDPPDPGDDSHPWQGAIA